jgi:hypothetical protein
MGILRQITLAAAALLAVLVPAAVEADICVDLEARLLQIDRTAQSGGNNARQFDVPIAQQKNEISRATAEARRAGCMGGFLIFQPRPEAKCGKLMATIDKMQANLQRLMSERGQYDNDPFAISQQRSQVLRALAQNRCGATYASNGGGLFDQQPPSGGGFFASLFGPRIQTYDAPFTQGTGVGTYRTMCVRTCDGFYFPISFSTVPSQFAADSATCQSMCPGTETSLYTYRNPGEDTEQMVSLSGDPYRALPNAFKFRTAYDKTCTCGSVAAIGSENFTEFQTNGTINPAAQSQQAAVPLPNLRPPRGEDPETIANRAGNFVPGPVVAGDDSGTAATTADGRKIRIVGPAYYYGQ